MAYPLGKSYHVIHDFSSNLMADLASGIPSAKRGEHIFMILQGYYDDSGSHDESPVYVVGGFLSDTNTWAAFTDEWQATLSKGPFPIDYLHMKEANRLTGQFKGCSPALRDQKVFELAELTVKYNLRRIDASILRSDFDDLLAGEYPGPVAKSPYFLCFYKIIIGLAREPSLAGKHITSMFDEQGRTGKDAGDAFDELREMYPEEYKLVSRPIFGSDIDFKPLQAADLYAWHARRYMVDKLSGDDRKQFIHIHMLLNKLENLSLPIDRDELIELAAHFIVIEAGKPA